MAAGFAIARPPALESYATERAIRERIRVRRETIELRKLEDTLISRDEVQVAVFSCGNALHEAMSTLPDRVAAEIAVTSDIAKVHEILTAEIRRALIEFTETPLNG